MTLAQYWLAGEVLTRPGVPSLRWPAPGEAPDYARVEAWLVDARLSYRADDRARGYRSLEHALRLASAEQLRLPFIMGRAWIRPVLRQDPRLAREYQFLLKPTVIGPGQALPPPPVMRHR